VIIFSYTSPHPGTRINYEENKMDTTRIQKNAISQIIGDLFAGTCLYSPGTQAAYHGPIEPHELNTFRGILGRLAENHYKDQLTAADVENAIQYCERTGREYGHVSPSFLTGTWGVRIGALKDILKLLALDWFDLLPLKSTIDLYENKWIIANYSINKTFLAVKLESINPDVNGFEYCLDYNDLETVKFLC
jgi:hypothetical protein